jgi:hypothetical protein
VITATAVRSRIVSDRYPGYHYELSAFGKRTRSAEFVFLMLPWMLIVAFAVPPLVSIRRQV